MAKRQSVNFLGFAHQNPIPNASRIGNVMMTSVISGVDPGTRNLPPEAGFGRAMAGLFSRFDITEPCDAAAQKRTGPFSPENKTALVSWIVA